MAAAGGQGMDFTPDSTRLTTQAQNILRNAQSAGIQSQTRARDVETDVRETQISETDRLLKGYRRMQPVIDDMREFFSDSGKDRKDGLDGYSAFRQRVERTLSNPEIPDEMKKPYELALQALNGGKDGMKTFAQQMRAMEDEISGLDPELAQESRMIKARREAAMERRKQRDTEARTGIMGQNAETSRINADVNVANLGTSRMNAETSRMATEGTLANQQATNRQGVVYDPSGNPLRGIDLSDQNAVMAEIEKGNIVQRSLTVPEAAKPDRFTGGTTSSGGSGAPSMAPVQLPALPQQQAPQQNVLDEARGPLDVTRRVMEGSFALSDIVNADNEVQAKSRLDALNQQLIPLLAVNRDDRTSVDEANRLLQRVLPPSSDFFGSEAGAANQFLVLQDEIARKYQENMAVVQDTRLSDRQRESALEYTKRLESAAGVIQGILDSSPQAQRIQRRRELERELERRRGMGVR